VHGVARGGDSGSTNSLPLAVFREEGPRKRVLFVFCMDFDFGGRETGSRGRATDRRSASAWVDGTFESSSLSFNWP
jgi:hypothetical protein